jgi:hypothetical protein
MPTTKTTDTDRNGFLIAGILVVVVVVVVDIFSIQHIAMKHILLLLNMHSTTFICRNGIDFSKPSHFNSSDL